MNPRKMRNKQIYYATMQNASKQLSCALSKDLRKKYGKRSARIIEGDTASIVRGEFAGVDGKVTKISIVDRGVDIEGVKKGPAEVRKQIHGAVIIRQKYAVHRQNGVRVQFEDNAGVLITPEGEMKGTDIKGPVASEVTEKWPRVANLAKMVV